MPQATNLLLLGLVVVCAAVRAQPGAAPEPADRPIAVDTAPHTESAARLAGDAVKSVLAFRIFAAADGVPQASVMAIAQDGDGYLWIGTRDGVARYDGRRVEAIDLGHGRGDPVSQLARLANGEVAVGTMRHGLFAARGRSVRVLPFTVKPEDEQTDPPAIEALLADADRLLIGTPQGLYRCAPDGTACAAEGATAGLEVAVMLADELEPDALWVGTNLDGLYRFEGLTSGPLQKSATHFSRADSLPNGAVRALAYHGEGAERALWIGTGRGLAKLRGGIATPLPGNADVPVLHLASVRHGDQTWLYAATFGRGFWSISPGGAIEEHGLAAGLPETFLYTVFSDSNGRLWFGTGSSGLLRLSPWRWRSFDERDGLPERGVVGLGEVELRGGPKIWVGTVGGAVALSDETGAAGARFEPLLPAPFQAEVVFDVAVSPDGRRFYATGKGLLEGEDGSPLRRYTNDDAGLPAVGVDSLLWVGDAQGELLIGTGHGLARWKDGEISQGVEGGAAELVGARINRLRAAADPADPQAAWIASSSGLHRRDGQGRVRAVPIDCLAETPIYDIETVDPGRMLFVAGASGVARIELRDDGIKCTQVAEPPEAARLAYELALDSRDRLYLFGYDGVRRINARSAVDDLNANGYTRFDTSDGLPSLEFNGAALFDRGGRLWAANSAGLAVLMDPLASAPVPAEAPLLLYARVAGQAMADGEVLPSEHGRLQFDYRLLSLVREHRIVYRTRLVGVETAWSDWTADAGRSFLRLPANDYRLDVEARDAAGRTHGPVSISFSISRPWWLQPWFFAGLALSLLLTGVGLGRIRARALSARARQLEHRVEERTAELGELNAELGRRAVTDPLTSVGNRRAFYQWIGDALQRPESSLLLALVDIDHFKAINDGHGHAIGDEVLVATAARLTDAASQTHADARVFRWGGEEFLIAANVDGAAAGQALAARLVEAFAAAPIDTEVGPLDVQCSVGYTVVRGRLRESAADPVVARADLALYRAKATGRNRAVGVLDVSGEGPTWYPADAAPDVRSA